MIIGPSYFIELPQVDHDTFNVGKVIALIQNMVMSILFLVQFYQRKNEGTSIAGQSFIIAFTKWIGTPLTVGLLAILTDPTGFMIVIVGLIFICDTWYMLAIYNELKSQGINPLKRL
ncbi:hypothetical protein EQK26_15215 (plasmid) [Lactiplantibacillus plantarum]|nr:hypothetical protein [Lactiplantibacillus plantarum]MCT4451732.1 hypothetical protein [Lactiplantibacillus plantarum]QAS28358.1 hypothetical protein EQK26_15215 [Lactiplantibacillus plantarum]